MQNLHTHTFLSDGKDSPEQMLEAAISMGFDSLGFSDHAPTEFSTEVEIDDLTYFDRISLAREKYKDRIKVFLGIELDYYSKGVFAERNYDYKIGSVHLALSKNGRLVEFDHTPEIAKKHVEEDFDGNVYSYAEAYFKRVAHLPERFDFDIVGHFDVLTKYVEKCDGFLDTGSPIYRKMAFEALHTVRKKRSLFELNTGAVARGWRSSPYPEEFLLREMRALDCKMVIGSDCHDKAKLNCYFKEARELLSSVGFREAYILTDSGFVGEKL